MRRKEMDICSNKRGRLIMQAVLWERLRLSSFHGVWSLNKPLGRKGVWVVGWGAWGGGGVVSNRRQDQRDICCADSRFLCLTVLFFRLCVLNWDAVMHWFMEMLVGYASGTKLVPVWITRASMIIYVPQARALCVYLPNRYQAASSITTWRVVFLSQTTESLRE